jgi:hypothetical protein
VSVALRDTGKIQAPVHLNPADAVITATEISAGHDTEAELALSIRYENGVEGTIVLDADTAFDVMRACGVADISALIGRQWRDILREL